MNKKLIFLPFFIQEKIKKGKLKKSYERELSLLIADVSGYTAMSERLDAETVTERINKLFSDYFEIIQKYRGDIYKFMGDAVIIFFEGKNKERRALKCAQEIIKETEKYKKWEISVKCAISTGKCLLYFAGNEKRKEFFITGKAYENITILEKKAEKKEIVVCDITFKKIGKSENLKTSSFCEDNLKYFKIKP